MIIDMPVRKQGKIKYQRFFFFYFLFYLDAYRALELLEEYYNRLDSPEDKPLKNAIDRYKKKEENFAFFQ
jgi:hypothetical protein